MRDLTNVELTHPFHLTPAFPLQTNQEDRRSGGGSTPFHSFLEHSMTYLFPFMLAGVLYCSTTHLSQLDLHWALLLGLPLGWVAGDFLTGLLHWLADTYGSVNTPVVGRSLLQPFRLHHRYPADICAHDLVETLGNSCIIATPVMTVSLYLLWDDESSALGAFAIFVLAIVALTTVLTNLFHKWAHTERPSLPIRLLQRAGLILGPEHHAGHHASPFLVSYCITNGWCNPLLDKLNFFRRLESCLSFCGLRPNREPEE